jgi:cellulose synthase/poly-beta-1,6-N-acetylglucosamine synthase-like glycosyltransferase
LSNQNTSFVPNWGQTWQFTDSFGEGALVAPTLIWLILTLCLLISVIKYTLAMILKWSVSGAKIEKDYSYRPAVSVLMPCYNEQLSQRTV